jgi:hypothetical protein
MMSVAACKEAPASCSEHLPVFLLTSVVSIQPADVLTCAAAHCGAVCSIEAAGARVAPKRLPSGRTVGEPRMWLQNAHGPGLLLSRCVQSLLFASGQPALHSQVELVQQGLLTCWCCAWLHAGSGGVAGLPKRCIGLASGWWFAVPVPTPPCAWLAYTQPAVLRCRSCACACACLAAGRWVT